MAKGKQQENVIRLKAQVWQVKTLVDGGINVTLALSENEISQVSHLLECKRRGAILEIAAVPVFVKPQEPDNAKKGKDDTDRVSRRKRRYPYR